MSPLAPQSFVKFSLSSLIVLSILNIFDIALTFFLSKSAFDPSAFFTGSTGSTSFY
jgi:hypothetical protein